MLVEMKLKAKTKTYIGGQAADMGQFGKKINVTGSMQRATGKVTLQLSAKGASVSTNFTLNGMFTKEGELVGTFTGCEISRDAGSVNGIFKATKEGSGAAAGGGGDEGEDEGEEDKED